MVDQYPCYTILLRLFLRRMLGLELTPNMAPAYVQGNFDMIKRVLGLFEDDGFRRRLILVEDASMEYFYGTATRTSDGSEKSRLVVEVRKTWERFGVPVEFQRVFRPEHQQTLEMLRLVAQKLVYSYSVVKREYRKATGKTPAHPLIERGVSPERTERDSSKEEFPKTPCPAGRSSVVVAAPLAPGVERDGPVDMQKREFPPLPTTYSLSECARWLLTFTIIAISTIASVVFMSLKLVSQGWISTKNFFTLDDAINLPQTRHAEFLGRCLKEIDLIRDMFAEVFEVMDAEVHGEIALPEIEAALKPVVTKVRGGQFGWKLTEEGKRAVRLFLWFGRWGGL